jgi:hypothetical protein
MQFWAMRRCHWKIINAMHNAIPSVTNVSYFLSKLAQQDTAGILAIELSFYQYIYLVKVHPFEEIIDLNFTKALL